MKRLTRHTYALLTPLLALAGLSSCRHKDLVYELEPTRRVKVVFDWTKAPDADPESMALYMYDRATGERLRYVFAGRDGGYIEVPRGSYDAVCMNADGTDWVVPLHTDVRDAFEIRTRDALETAAYALPTRAIPRAPEAEDERVAATPGMLWSGTLDAIDLTALSGESEVRLTPSEAVCHYSVEVRDIENIQYLRGVVIDGTLSGMSEGYVTGSNRSSDGFATFPFTLSLSAGQDRLEGAFLTFGETPAADRRHSLVIYTIGEDGQKFYYSYDVTNQVSKAPDPRHVHIVVSGMKVPTPITSGGGFHPNVNDWQGVDIDLPMGT